MLQTGALKQVAPEHLATLQSWEQAAAMAEFGKIPPVKPQAESTTGLVRAVHIQPSDDGLILTFDFGVDETLYERLRDLMLLHEGAGEIRNLDIRGELEALAAAIQFAWIRKAVGLVDEIAQLIRRNIQKTIALDALILHLRLFRGQAT